MCTCVDVWMGKCDDEFKNMSCLSRTKFRGAGSKELLEPEPIQDESLFFTTHQLFAVLFELSFVSD